MPLVDEAPETTVQEKAKMFLAMVDGVAYFHSALQPWLSAVEAPLAEFDEVPKP